MTEIRLIIRQKDKDGFAWTRTTLLLTNEEFDRINKALESIQADVPSIEFMIEKVEEIKI